MTNILLFNTTFFLPPSSNSLYGGGSGQKRFMSKRYKQWVSEATALPSLKLTGVLVLYKTYFANKRATDNQNYLKATTDYLVKSGLLVDDCWQELPAELVVTGGVDKIKPRIEVYVFNAAQVLQEIAPMLDVMPIPNPLRTLYLGRVPIQAPINGCCGCGNCTNHCV